MSMMVEFMFSSVPGQPRNFRGFAIEADSIQLMWSPPEVPDGHILMEYGLWYSASNTPLEVDSKPGTEAQEQKMPPSPSPPPSAAPAGEQMRTIKSDATQFVLRDLKSGMLYHLRLAGRTMNGYGASASVDVRTQEHRKYFSCSFAR
ncbi:unnamed protein product [Schistocephalus solidus]|uniref:Fibronectin type-III domain-containing protein n=1 Tax=Schistocephalus solidus TaxID=70667 RepID=A0A183SQL0_SCHSO|nr:unnamed protein product [Schistocephalus solidus]